ncbi:hypothetical protein [Haloarcula onubensis]|uniref:Baseplate protein J-like domain-containing protein n=1 Tax=Haloarcula onubensis TaxID=2950539 RepID=A0ABU2FV84_9EURY|nr:hypothetical protein [Halomicroarcula sp. S3CR25-11]MDS0284683.1 hypothetical protein [Halomicroarcula sp. S3CR25-11]
MPDRTLEERLPSAFPSYDDDTDFGAWLDAHQDEVDGLDADLDSVQQSHQVAHATGNELDLIGADFGILGRRRGRDDDSYRQFLQSLIPAYSGRGTPPGLRTAVAAGVLTTKDDIGLVEDFDANRYEVELYDWEPHKTGTVHTLANVADPSVVQRRDPLHYYSEATSLAVRTDSTIALGIHNLAPSASVSMTGESTLVQDIRNTLAAAAFVAAGGDTTTDLISAPLGNATLGDITLGLPSANGTSWTNLGSGTLGSETL